MLSGAVVEAVVSTRVSPRHDGRLFLVGQAVGSVVVGQSLDLEFSLERDSEVFQGLFLFLDGLKGWIKTNRFG